ncbi:MAG: hypothetical protein GEV05_15095 [Betaproteobacteria bacterium]|nr:hypothetical protein [Betaproteobacteria bacterium]
MRVKAEVSIVRKFVAAHSLPTIGVGERHEHLYEVHCGYSSRIETRVGCARPLQQIASEIDAVVARIQGKNLNVVLPVPPTAEMVACWLLAHLPSHWEWVAIKAYDGFECKITREDAEPSFKLLRGKRSRVVKRLRAGGPRALR